MENTNNNNKRYFLAKEGDSQEGGMLFRYYSPLVTGPVIARDPLVTPLYANPMKSRPAGMENSIPIGIGVGQVRGKYNPTKTLRGTTLGSPVPGTVTVRNMPPFSPILGGPMGALRKGNPIPGTFDFPLYPEDGKLTDKEYYMRGPPIFHIPYGFGRFDTTKIRFELNGKKMEIKIPYGKVGRMLRILYDESIRSPFPFGRDSDKNNRIEVIGPGLSWKVMYGTDEAVVKAVSQIADMDNVKFYDRDNKNELSKNDVLGELKIKATNLKTTSASNITKLISDLNTQMANAASTGVSTAQLNQLQQNINDLRDQLRNLQRV